jgi:hypothetical protein
VVVIAFTKPQNAGVQETQEDCVIRDLDKHRSKTRALGGDIVHMRTSSGQKKSEGINKDRH